MRGEYRDGLPHGRWATWHPGGALTGEVEFRDGRPNGTLRGWYATGRPSFIGNFRDGIAIGRLEIFDADGRLRSASEFGVDGKERGRWAWDEANRPIDPKSPDAHAAWTRALQSTFLIYMALMESTIPR